MHVTELDCHTAYRLDAHHYQFNVRLTSSHIGEDERGKYDGGEVVVNEIRARRSDVKIVGRK